jgi:ATP-dependent 26S proteasome regulatory subunit
MEFLLLSKISTNNLIYDMGIILIILPLLTYLKKFFEDEFPKIFKKILLSQWKIITFNGIETLHFNGFTYDLCNPFIALCYYINKHNLCDQNKFRNVKGIEYIIDKSNIKISDDIYIDIETESTPPNLNTDSIKSSLISTKQLILTIKSKKKSIEELQKFVKNITDEFAEHNKNKNNNKFYHFVYQGLENDRCRFIASLLSNLDDPNEKSYETFDTLFSEHKDNLMKTMDRLKDIEYYRKTGSKRKAGFLFHGRPGCGKTSHVTAMANYGNRHIIEVPMSRIKKNKEIESILSLTEINFINFNKDQIIIYFDEIDQVGSVINKRDNEIDVIDKNKEILEKTKKSVFQKKEEKQFVSDHIDDINLGNLLSRLDGIGNYNGMIIIAATNCIDELSPALYRHGRLTPLEFDYCRKEDMINIIEYRYSIKLTEREIDAIPDKDHKITPPRLIYMLEKNFLDNKKKFFDKISKKIK